MSSRSVGRHVRRKKIGFSPSTKLEGSMQLRLGGNRSLFVAGPVTIHQKGQANQSFRCTIIEFNWKPWWRVKFEPVHWRGRCQGERTIAKREWSLSGEKLPSIWEGGTRSINIAHPRSILGLILAASVPPAHSNLHHIRGHP